MGCERASGHARHGFDPCRASKLARAQTHASCWRDGSWGGRSVSYMRVGSSGLYASVSEPRVYRLRCHRRVWDVVDVERLPCCFSPPIVPLLEGPAAPLTKAARLYLPARPSQSSRCRLRSKAPSSSSRPAGRHWFTTGRSHPSETDTCASGRSPWR